MAIVLWVVQGVLAAMFLMAGTMKMFRAKETLRPQMPWVEDLPVWGVKVIGALEFAAALGLILPMVTGIFPWLTPLAASGLVLIMLGAMVLHTRRKEPQGIAINFVFLALALFVAYGRFVLIPTVA